MSKQHAITREVLTKAEAWVESQSHPPPEIVAMVEVVFSLVSSLEAQGQKTKSLLQSLRRELGILPKSERKKSGKILPEKSKDPKVQIDKIKSLAAWHRNLCKRHTERAKAMENKMQVKPLSEYELSPEQEAEANRETEEQFARAALGNGKDPAFSQPAEDLMKGMHQQLELKEHVVSIEDHQLSPGLVPVGKSFFEMRTRYGFSISATQLNLQVEKRSYKTPEGDTVLIAGGTSSFGPAGSKVTWEFLTNMVLLSTMFAVPFNRFGLLVSGEDHAFSGGDISRYFKMVAGRFLPIYQHLGHKLANLEVMAGDDTPPRVLEIRKHLDALKADSTHALPWKYFRNTEEALETYRVGKASSLGSNASKEDRERSDIYQKYPLSVAIACDLGFESLRRDRENKAKISLNTTVVSGKSDPQDVRSTIIFYRSHLGSFGNLAEMLMFQRSPSCKDLVLVSDLSTTNLVTDPQLTEKFNIRQAGCTSHARRPFAQNQQDDPERLEHLLHAFRGLYINEKLVELNGRNHENVTAVRREDSRPAWELIKELCHGLKERWPKDHPVGRGARYVIKNYDALTYHLEDPRVPISNDFSERMVRMEKLIQDNALFRNSIEGRCALDIMRTVVQTAVAAGADVQQYIEAVLRAPPEEVESDPSKYTPDKWSDI